MTKISLKGDNSTTLAAGTTVEPETFPFADAGVGSYVGIVDPANPTRALAPDVNGALPITNAAEAALIGAVAEAAPANDTASSGLNGRLQRVAQRLSSMIALLPTALGAGGGLKVDGSGTALPVSGTVSVTGVATETTLDARTGSLTEVAPASDTASSGINGRLQRIAQRITSMIALLPTSLGAGGGLKVDGSGTALPVSAASLPLPSGAATAAKQPALGTAGAASADVITVQGNASGTPIPVSGSFSQAASELHLGEVGSALATPSANFTRPADTTAYASADLVANSTTAGSVTPLSWTAARIAAGSFLVRRARFKKSTTTTANGSFRLHLYDTTPATITNGDNGAWLTTNSGYLGSLEFDFSGTTGRVHTDGASCIGLPTAGSELSVKLSSGQTIYGLIEARGAYAPGLSEVFTMVLELLLN